MGLVLNNPTNSSATDVLTRDIVKEVHRVQAKYIGFFYNRSPFTFRYLILKLSGNFVSISVGIFLPHTKFHLSESKLPRFLNKRESSPNVFLFFYFSFLGEVGGRGGYYTQSFSCKHPLLLFRNWPHLNYYLCLVVDDGIR